MIELLKLSVLIVSRHAGCHFSSDAGRILASRLRHHNGRTDLVVLALPRGGIPVAYEIGKELGAPVDVFVVRKLGVPGQEELAMVYVTEKTIWEYKQVPRELS